ncbi:MAG: Fic family protein [Saprospiraceae bacterium]|nr:Fic family protein [Saprospiraceae bacterium]
MNKFKFNILSTELYEQYCENITTSFLEKYKSLEDSELSISTFSFYTSVSAVYSSKIEGEHIELDSYIKHKRFGIEFIPDYTLKIDDLYNAYQFAKTAKCNSENIFLAHKILTKNILPEIRQGKIRTGNMYVTAQDGRIEYVAASPFQVTTELNKLFADLEILLNTELNIQEVFFFASMLHLVFVKIHPFDDGNGRCSRLFEKWFLAEKLGQQAWLIQSEKNYYSNHRNYYKNISLIGLEYETLDYMNALPFLLMLPQSLNINENE